jgi:hypothetical protein
MPYAFGTNYNKTVLAGCDHTPESGGGLAQAVLGGDAGRAVRSQQAVVGSVKATVFDVRVCAAAVDKSSGIRPKSLPRHMISAIETTNAITLCNACNLIWDCGLVHSELRKRYWGRRFWARGYFSTTSGNVTDDIITQYLKLHSSK